MQTVNQCVKHIQEDTGIHEIPSQDVAAYNKKLVRLL